ncbi:MAG: threonine synthase [bacterium]|nr:threonine synthase [bacterium]
MRYVSTRGGVPPVGFADAMIAGLAPDGGLYVPQELPAIDLAEIRSWSTLCYADLATEVISRFAGDMDRAVVAAACRQAYSAEVFGSTEVVPAVALMDDTWLLRLSNGPTLAFKDMAMQLLGRLFDAELARRGERLLVVGATSGDTGSSAEHAMIGRKNISVVMLSPLGRVSPFQAAQMYSIDEPNIVNLAIDGVFDEAQDLVKAVNADAAFKAAHSIGAVNSINWARVAAQIVYYVWAWLRLAPEPDGEIQMAVPTGNFGNIYAGTVARRLGLPIRFILATNENDVLDEFFRTGVYRVRSKDQVAVTSSPSMDIAKASNFERFVFDLHGGDGAAVSRLWSQLHETGQFDLSSLSAFNSLSDWMVSGSSVHDNRVETIRRIAVGDGVLVDPHTADGIFVGQQLRRPGPLVCLETAQPAKFGATIIEALGQDPPRPDGLVGLESLPQHVTVIDADLAAVRSQVEALAARQGG